MYGNPWYNNYYNYPSNAAYNPYLHPSYQHPSPFEPRGRPFTHDVDMQERARALAEQRARRAQYLPDEVSDEEDNWEYNQFGPRERAYLNAKKRQDMLEQQQRQRALLEQQRLRALEQRRREEEARLRMQEEQRNHARLQRDQDTRSAEREKRFPHPATSQRDRSASRGPLRPSTTAQPRSPVSVKAEHPSQHTPGSQIPRSPSQAPPRQPTPNSKSAPAFTPSIKYTEEHEKAASLIQQRYRIHATSRTLDKIASQFQELKNNFVYPSSIDFQKPGEGEETVSIPATRPPSDFDNDNEEPMEVDGPPAKLAYTSKNYALHQYADSMDKLLMKLDGIESWGDKGLRLKRRQYVRDIEKEASKLERYWKQAWMDHLAKQSTAQEQANGEAPEKEEKMEVEQQNLEKATDVEKEQKDETKGSENLFVKFDVKDELEAEKSKRGLSRAPSLKRHVTN